MIERMINLIVRILTGGKYSYVNDKNIKPVIILEKVNSFDVDSLIDFDACDELYGINKGDKNG